jgi:signal transduction histidine kinase
MPDNARPDRTLLLTDRSPGTDSRASRLVALDRFLVSIGVIRATAVLTIVAVLASLLLTVVLEYQLYSRLKESDMVVAALVATLVSAPICAYAQILIGKIRASRQSLKLLTTSLALAVARAEDASRAKSRFLANMSHELRTPLNAINGFSEMMSTQVLGPVGNPRYLDYAKDIHNSGAHLLDIINDILDLARIESGQAELRDVTECEMETIIASKCRMMQPIAEKRQVSLLPGRGHAPVRLLASDRMVGQVVINVLSNATKFTPAGGRVSIDQTITEAGDYVLTVTDSGIGMSPEQIVVALTPFGQNETRLDDGNKGTGLGLPLAKAMMDMHNGSLSVDSAPGRGTTVRLTFPAERVVGVAQSQRA